MDAITTDIDDVAPAPKVSRGQTRKQRGHVNNTCANSTLQMRLTKQLAGIQAHLVNHPHDVLSQARVSKIKGLLSR